MTPKLHKNNAEIATLLKSALPKSELSDSYKFAFEDIDFLLSKETRGIRFQLELLKPEITLKERGINHTIVVFGSARCVSKQVAEEMVNLAKTEAELKKARQALDSSHHYESSRKFGSLVAQYNLSQEIADHHLHICTGGGPGIMEAANRGAYESGDLSVGLNIGLPHEQRPNPYITPDLSFRFHYFAVRKMHFMIRARAIVAYPGGFGSFDELFECLTLIQTKKIQRLPVILVHKEFWETVIRFDLLVSQGLIDQADLDLINFVETPEEAWQIIVNWYELHPTK